MAQKPIFIIGSPRSGTTLLRLILDSHPNISCGPETHFLSELSKIVNTRWEQVETFGFDKAYWHQKIASFFDSFQTEYAQKRGKGRWAEKTPKYTTMLDFINELFPDSQMIHIIRDGRDVVTSHRDRWGYKVAMRSINDWKTYVTMANEFGKKVSSDRYIEVRYEELVTQPENILRGLFTYLNEPWDPVVLKHNEVEHDMREVSPGDTENSRRTATAKSAIHSSRVGAGKGELDPLLKGMLYFRAGKLLNELGYQ